MHTLIECGLYLLLANFHYIAWLASADGGADDDFTGGAGTSSWSQNQ